jgi:hypothetical protein
MEYKYGTTESLEKAFSTAVAESKVYYNTISV